MSHFIHRVTSVLLTSTLAISLAAYAQIEGAPEQLYQNMGAELTPTLAKPGQYKVGVKTLSIVNPQQLNVNTQKVSDRSLVLEIWYPTSQNQNGPMAHYDNETRLGQAFSLQGSAYRDAPVFKGAKPIPLIVLSHGYTGYRSLMFYLGEHLASHGYIVAAIDHTDSTNKDVDMVKAGFAGFPSTLYNRSRDQQFTLNYLLDETNFLSAVIDPEKAGLVGYSMGGYGAVNTIGGCYQFTDAAITTFMGIKDQAQAKAITKLFNSCAGGQYDKAQVDPRWAAAIAFAPWGNQHNLFDPQALKSIETPVLYVSGEFDDVSDYASIKRLFKATGGEHTYLLTYNNARHNIAAHPAPKVARDNEMNIGHYFEGSWNSQQLNSNNKHFALAMMNCHVKQDESACPYLELSADSNERVIDGVKTPNWLGFPKRYSTGMEWQY